MKKQLPRLGVLCFVLLVAVACSVPTQMIGNTPETELSTKGSHIPLIVEVDWLKSQLTNPQIRIIEYGRKVEDYLTGHIPGAVFLDRKTAWDQVGGVKGMLPSVETMVDDLEKAGIGNALTVIIYDDMGGLWASRIFWALEYLGHRDVHVLNGGLHKWLQRGFALQISSPTVAMGHFIPRIEQQRLAKKDWILENIDNPMVQLVDSRSKNEYQGVDVRAAQGGHISGAANLNWINHLGPSDAKTFLSQKQLAHFYSSQNISMEKAVVTYCQTGVRGAHAYFVLRLLGYPNVRVYDGSWAEWGNDENTPKVPGTKNIAN